MQTCRKLWKVKFLRESMVLITCFNPGHSLNPCMGHSLTSCIRWSLWVLCNTEYSVKSVKFLSLLATKKCGFSSLHSSQAQYKYHLDLHAMGFLSKMWILEEKINLAKHHYMTELPRNSPESNIHDLWIYLSSDTWKIKSIVVRSCTVC